MICKFCSQEMADGVTFCPNCGAAVAQDPAPAPVEEAPAFTSEQFNPNPSPAPEEVQPKKKRPGIAIAVIAVVAVLALVAVLNWSAILGASVKAFGSPQDYMVFTETKQLLNAGDSLIGTVNAPSDGAGIDQSFKLWFPEDSYLASVISEDITFNMNTHMKGNLLKYVFDIRYGEEALLSLECCGDTDTQDLYFGIKELNEKYLYIKGENETAVDPDSFVLSEQDQEQLAELLGDCFKTFVNSFDNVTKEDNSYVVNGVEQGCTVLSLHVTEAELSDALKEVLVMLKDNKALKELTVRHSSEEDYTKLCDSIDKALESLEDAAKYLDGDTDILTYNSYVNGKHEIIGRDLVIDGEDIFSYKTAKDGNTTHSQFSLSTITLNGEMTDKNGTLNGMYSLLVNNKDCGSLTVSDLNTEAFSGEIRLIPTGDLLSAFDLDLGSSGALVATLSKDSNTYSVKTSAQFNEETLLGLDYTMTLLEGKDIPDITLPSKEQTVDGTDTLEVAKWCYEWTIDPLVEKLKNANLPEELLSGLKSTLLSTRLGYLEDTPYYEEAMAEYLKELFGDYGDIYGDYGDDPYYGDFGDFEDDPYYGDFGDFEDDPYYGDFGDFEDDPYYGDFGDFEDDPYYGDYDDMFGL